MITALDRVPDLVKYELLERIGLGGMATVYRARDRRLGREVAVKLIHPHLRENAEVAARFVSESRAVARLRHPNVVEVFDVSDENEPERYLVVELVRGTTLRALLSRHRRLPPELAAAIGLEVAAALSHAHHEGIVHRDVKPENVLVDLSASISNPNPISPRHEQRRVKLTDFGIAKLLDAQGVTSTGQVLGSPAHMAPEQIEGGDVGPRADVFALGVMLYESMVGRLPFDGKNPAQVLRRVLDGTYPPADREQPTVGARWAQVLARALERDAADRYESIEAFAAAIRAELESLGIQEPHRAIDDFLGDQEGYAEAVVPRTADALVAAGEAARQKGDYPVAAAQFNRALAYRPGDADLLKRVSRVARRTRWMGIVRVAGVAAIAVGAGVLAVSWFVRRGPASGAKGVPLAPARTAEALTKSPPATVVSPGGVTVPPGPSSATPHRRPALREAPPRKPPPPAAIEPAMRLVTVDVSGPKGGYLNIDGVRRESWFGQKFTLPVGLHTFEFVPKDSDCCRASPPLAKMIEEGSTDAVVPVLLSVQFRDARLNVNRSPPGVLTCGQLFGAELAVPGGIPVRMSRYEVPARCVLTPQDTTLGPMTKDVTLTAGQITDVSFP